MCRTKNRSLRVEIIKFTFTDTRSFSITGHAKETSMFKHLWILTYLYAQTGAFQNVPNSSHSLLFDFWITEFTSRTILILLCSPSSSKAFFFFCRKDFYSSNSWYNNDIFRWHLSLVKETVHLLQEQGLKLLSNTLLERSKQKDHKIFWVLQRLCCSSGESQKKLGRKMPSFYLAPSPRECFLQLLLWL